MKISTFSAALALLAGAGFLGGCVTENPDPKPQLKVPWPQENAPDNMAALAEDLMAFEAATGSLPATLAQIDQAHLGTAGAQYAAHDYAYHLSGTGILRDGWRVLAVNDRILPKEDGYAWIVARAPVHIKGTPTLQVVKVSLAELSQAAVGADSQKGTP